jgi:hypothetical protein
MESQKMQNNELTARNKQLPNIGVLEAKVPYELFEGLSGEIERIIKEGNGLTYNHNLVGHIQEEYSLNHVKDHLEEFLIAMASTWQEANPGLIDAYEEAAKLKDWSFYLDSMWFNKQKKHEFNPLHFHSGALSFVIWIKIPYDLEDEVNYFPPVSGAKDDPVGNAYTSKFCFYYTNSMGRITPAMVPVDKTYEGTIVMFPSEMLHAVYPFYTSDDYRISVSGNLRICPPKKGNK